MNQSEIIRDEQDISLFGNTAHLRFFYKLTNTIIAI